MSEISVKNVAIRVLRCIGNEKYTLKELRQKYERLYPPIKSQITPPKQKVFFGGNKSVDMGAFELTEVLSLLCREEFCAFIATLADGSKNEYNPEVYFLTQKGKARINKSK